jgi:hypothetical protein
MKSKEAILSLTKEISDTPLVIDKLSLICAPKRWLRGVEGTQTK